MKYELEYTSDFEKDKEKLRKSGELPATVGGSVVQMGKE